jgi:uncharacterized protein (DUF2267 family)
MSQTGLAAFDRAVHTANRWLADVAAEFDADDHEFVYRVTRAWLHAVRDRLPLTDAAHLGAQLPELLRGVYYDGFDPAQLPVKYNRDQFVARFAADARVSGPDVPRARAGGLDRVRPPPVRAPSRRPGALPGRPAGHSPAALTTP